MSSSSVMTISVTLPTCPKNKPRWHYTLPLILHSTNSSVKKLSCPGTGYTSTVSESSSCLIFHTTPSSGSVSFNHFSRRFEKFMHVFPSQVFLPFFAIEGRLVVCSSSRDWRVPLRSRKPTMIFWTPRRKDCALC